ncbi:hypothetical protein ASE85_10990 [Sphingobium sp. Leaf26]|nr:hypothetical protein ASE85_10990 [Sphingobium sp. Leaf26]
MNRQALEEYLHRQIPLAAAVAAKVVHADAHSLTLSAPLAPNLNHKSTAFGGSISVLGILAAWAIVHTRLESEGVACEVVIQSSQMDYLRPITGIFTAKSSLVRTSDWPIFMKMLARRKRARIEVGVTLFADDLPAATMTGRFVAFRRE